MSLFTDIWNNKPSAIPTLKELYITHIQQLLNQPQKNSAQINNAIQAYLSDFYDDTEILLLLAGQYAYTNNFYDMLNTMQLSTNYAYTATQKGIIDKAYSELILYTDTLLSEQQQWQALISVYLHSENTGLLREQDTLRLVELYIAQDNTYLAFDYAEKLENKPQWKKQLADLLPKTQVKEVGEDLAQAAINLQKVADQFIIVIQISGNDTTLLIDTGASITTLSKAYFESIQRRSQFTFRQKQTFLTANGETTGEIYTVDEFQIGQYLLPNVDIAVIDFPTSPHSSGLLGMNVLRDFKFEIDQKNALLTLEKNAP
jgi:clan AA aspartic protease (TIGR02281 family)